MYAKFLAASTIFHCVYSMENPSFSDLLLLPAISAARMLSMGESTFWQYVKAGKLPQPIKIGGMTRWRVADLREWVAQAPTISTVGPTDGTRL